MEQEEIEVLVSITITNVVKVLVDDYYIVDSGIDEDGTSYTEVDFSTCDLKEAVLKQIQIPTEGGWDYDLDDLEVEIYK